MSKTLLLVLLLAACANRPNPPPDNVAAANGFNALAQTMHGIADAHQQMIYAGPYTMQPAPIINCWNCR